MKTKIIQFCLSALSFLVLASCVSYFPPNSTISSKSFSLTSPNEEDWRSLEQPTYAREYEYKTGEIIWIEKGSPGGYLGGKDYPIKTILILRDTLLETSMDEKLSRTKLNEISMVKVKNIVDSLLLWAGSLRNFKYDSLSFNQYNFTQYYYGVGWEPDSVGIGQYYIYLPKYYNDYKTYYLFIYDEFPTKSLGNELTDIIEKFKCIEDSVRH